MPGFMKLAIMFEGEAVFAVALYDPVLAECDDVWLVSKCL
jgi:hypothetical protein